MSNRTHGAIALSLLCLAFNASADLADMPSGAYSVDPNHGYITYTYSHQGFSFPTISFRSFEVDLNLDPENPENSTLAVLIDATSIDSQVDVFNGHLNGPNFFDTKNHPTITFTSTSIESTGENTFDIHGELTIKGHTNPVTLAATINKAGHHPRRNTPIVGVSATAKVSRSEWGLDRAIPLVGDEITISISAELNHD